MLVGAEVGHQVGRRFRPDRAFIVREEDQFIERLVRIRLVFLAARIELFR